VSKTWLKDFPEKEIQCLRLDKKVKVKDKQGKLECLSKKLDVCNGCYAYNLKV
jgi:hypothetical protein